MRRQDQRPDELPTFLWIAWREGETDRVECLCRAHRAYVFECYAASAHGLNRRGERCGMCVRSQPARTVGLPGTDARPTPSGDPGDGALDLAEGQTEAEGDAQLADALANLTHRFVETLDPYERAVEALDALEAIGRERATPAG